MADIHLETFIAAPPEVCFDLERDVDVHQASTSGTQEKAVAGVTKGRMRLGDEVTWEARQFGFKFSMTSKIVAFDRPSGFSDEMLRGPFHHWRHDHGFSSVNGGTLMVDDVEFSSPLGPLGRLVDAVVLSRHMYKLLSERNDTIRRLAEQQP
jgi:ligand-binding SRPBCC domain-containing protein